MTTRIRLSDLINEKTDKKIILNSNILISHLKEDKKYNKIEITNSFTSCKIIIDIDEKDSINITKIISFSSKDIPHEKIIVDNVYEKDNCLYLNILPLLTTA